MRQNQGYTPSLFEDNASLRRREGLRAWDEEKERRRQESQSEQGHDGGHLGIDPNRRPSDPFADFRSIAGFQRDIDGEDGDLGRPKGGESQQGREEMMLEGDSIHRRSLLHQPMLTSPWGENPFSATMNPFASDPFLSQDSVAPPRRGSISPFASSEPLLPISNSKPNSSGEEKKPEQQPFVGRIQRAGPVVPPRPPPSGSPPPAPSRSVGNGRRGAITDVPGVIPRLGGPVAGSSGVQVHVRVSTAMAISPPPPPMSQKENGPRIAPLTPPLQQSPSPPQSRNGSSIELLENPRLMS